MTYLIFAFLILTWSYSWVIAKIALNYTSAFGFSLLRTFIGTIVVFLFIILTKKLQRPKDILLIILLGLTQTTGFFIFANLSLVSGGAGKVSILIYTMPFWSIIFARLFLKEPISRAQKFAILGALFGLASIIEPWNLKTSLLSDFFAIMSAISWAISIIIAKIIISRKNINLLSINAYQMLFGLFGIIISFLFIPSQKLTILSPYLIFAILYAGIIATALGWFLWLYVLQKLKVNVVSLSSLAVPILTILEAWIQLGESPNFFESIGILLIIFSLIIIYLDSTRKIKMGHQ